MKQILSVADFATILQLLDEKISKMENACRFGSCVNEDKIIGERLKELKRNPYYLSLLHLKESLQNFKIKDNDEKMNYNNIINNKKNKDNQFINKKRNNDNKYEKEYNMNGGNKIKKLTMIKKIQIKSQKSRM